VTTLPVLDPGPLRSAARGTSSTSHSHETEASLRALALGLRQACTEWGAFYLKPSPLGPLQRRLLEAATVFFELSEPEKAKLALSRSSHFRGYSALHSWCDAREQLHLGPELGAELEGSGVVAAAGPDYLRLLGPNLWPETLGMQWRSCVLEYFTAVAELGRQLLVVLETAFELPAHALTSLLGPTPYQLQKLMRYAPGSAVPRELASTAMAAHCDWSLITLLLQSSSGLQVCTPHGVWLEAPAMDDSLLVTLGELLEIVTGGLVCATPHRVSSVGAARISVPVFVNPGLHRRVTQRSAGRVRSSAEHVHRVRPLWDGRPSFVFGESEWQRKGLAQWCYRGQCLGAQ
jgi:isopenicillin N synthase-like dioxygenase